MGTRLVLTVGIAALALIAAVTLAERQSESPERSSAASAATRVPADNRLELRLGGSSSPAAMFFIVATEAAREDLLWAIQGETVVRQATHEPARLAWVAVAETDAEAAAVRDAVHGDAGIGDVVAVEVIDLR